MRFEGQRDDNRKCILVQHGKELRGPGKLGLNKQALYKTFNTLGDLAEKAGEIKMGVGAQSEEGFDRNRLRNAVKKSLEESGIEIKISEE